jgi:hypothetical protein
MHYSLLPSFVPIKAGAGVYDTLLAYQDGWRVCCLGMDGWSVSVCLYIRKIDMQGKVFEYPVTRLETCECMHE